jgi:16S rRNA processing protein RimM
MRDEGAANLWAIGYITGSFGIKGFVKTKPLTDTIERFKRLRRVYRGLNTENVIVDEVEKIEIRDNIVLLKFGGISDKTGADSLRGHYIFVDGREVETPKRGRYFIHDVVGCTVITTDNRQIGVVKEVYKMLAYDLWEIEDGKKHFMIPAVKEFIRSVDCKKRVITVHLIDGLIDT